jgi:hypothetical protein
VIDDQPFLFCLKKKVEHLIQKKKVSVIVIFSCSRKKTW